MSSDVLAKEPFKVVMIVFVQSHFKLNPHSATEVIRGRQAGGAFRGGFSCRAQVHGRMGSALGSGSWHNTTTTRTTTKDDAPKSLGFQPRSP